MQKILIPATIKFGGFDYVITSDEEAKKHLDARNAWGYSNSTRQQILLDPTATQQRLSSNFIHEVVHIIDFEWCGEVLTEKTVNDLSHGLFQVFEQLGIQFGFEKGTE